MDCAFRFNVLHVKHCISFSLIITGICNCSYLVLQIGAIFALFMQRNMSVFKGEDRISRFLGKCHIYLHFLLPVSPARKYFVWGCRVRATANISGTMILKSQIRVVSCN